jgi:hypothetical protein
MVIQVTYQTVTDAKDPHSSFVRTKYFDAPGSELPQKALILRKLRGSLGQTSMRTPLA